MERVGRSRWKRRRGPASRRVASWSLCGTLTAAVLAIACGTGDEASSGTSTTTAAGDGASHAEASDAGSEVALATRGKSVYMANCIACHSTNPAQDGALGPAVAGASMELLEARVLRAEYPPGYTPKRPSRLMVAMPHLEREIDALHAYLNDQS